MVFQKFSLPVLTSYFDILVSIHDHITLNRTSWCEKRNFRPHGKKHSHFRFQNTECCFNIASYSTALNVKFKTRPIQFAIQNNIIYCQKTSKQAQLRWNIAFYIIFMINHKMSNTTSVFFPYPKVGPKCYFLILADVIYPMSRRHPNSTFCFVLQE